uniref:SUV3_C domain-containing protein n=1 Tax=Heligmosomoides polygyrus TaxID=6339 RepID=A0A183FB70_HELPZ
LDTYLWLSLRFPDMLPDETAIRDACKQLDAMLQVSVENILQLLDNSAMGDARKVSDYLYPWRQSGVNPFGP